MLHTTNTIDIVAPADKVFDLASNVLRWPQILEHYRYVRLLESGHRENLPRRRVKMSASRSGLPVTWTALQELDRPELQIRYEHVEGVTRGMRVVWKLVPDGNVVHVTIDHDLDSPWWVIRTKPGEYIVGAVFVKHIADQTLRGIKHAAEGGL